MCSLPVVYEMNIFSRTTCLKVIDATVGLCLCKVLGRLRRILHRPVRAADPSPEKCRRILIIRPGGIGDMLVLLPLLHRIREAMPQSTIDIVCEKRNFEVLKLAGFENQAILYDSNPVGLVRRLISTDYDVAIDTEQFHNFSALFACLSGAPVRIGFKINPARLALYTHLINYDMEGHESLQFARLLGPLGLRPQGESPATILPNVPCRIAEPVERELARLSSLGPVIALCPGSRNHYKRWSATKFKELIARLTRKGCTIALVGGREDLTAAGSLLDGIPEKDRAISCVGTLKLAELATLLQRVSLFVGCDSGLAHLAGALGRPTVVLFGPSDPKKWAVHGAEHTALCKNLSCQPCSVFGYVKPCHDVSCIANITVNEVTTACEKLLPTQ